LKTRILHKREEACVYLSRGIQVGGMKFFYARSGGNFDCQRLIEDQLWHPHALAFCEEGVCEDSVAGMAL
jgi:hypothetical protein